MSGWGDDTINAHDGEADGVDCGGGDPQTGDGGADIAEVDSIDTVSGCELQTVYGGGSGGGTGGSSGGTGGSSGGTGGSSGTTGGSGGGSGGTTGGSGGGSGGTTGGSGGTTGGSGGGGGNPGGRAATFTIAGPRNETVGKSGAFLTGIAFTCPVACTAKATAVATTGRVHTAAKKRSVTVAAAVFKLAAGSRHTLKVNLNQAGKRLLSHAGRLTVSVKVAVSASGRAVAYQWRTLVLKRKKR